MERNDIPGMQNPPNSSSNSSGGSSSNKSKKDIFEKITEILRKIFRFLKALIHFLGELVSNFMGLVSYLFQWVVKIASDPSSPAFVAIVLFIIVSVIAGFNWFQIGTWLGSVFGLSEIAGIGLGAVGVLVGLGLNIFQLSSELWKVQRSIANAYKGLGVDPDTKLEKPTLNQKLAKWSSYDHRTLKNTRSFSYVFETVVIATYTVLGAQLTPISIIISAISLICPEYTLHMVSSMTSLLGDVKEQIVNSNNQGNIKL